MNQRIIIYIILSAILLYLYYRRRDITIFAAFIVVVGSTLIFRDTREGFGLGGGGGGDKECAKMGFTAPKIDKKDIKGSLEKVMKNVKTVASKYMKNLEEGMTLKEPYNKALETIGGFEIVSSELKKLGNNEKNKDYAISNFGMLTFNRLIMPFIFMKPSEKQDEAVKMVSTFNKKDDQGKVPIVLILKGGPIILEILNKIKKSDEMKEADKEAKELLSVAVCAVKHFISLWKNIQKATADGGGGDDDAGDEEKPKKKSNKQDDDDAGDEEEKPKKKKKKQEEDDGGDE